MTDEIVRCKDCKHKPIEDHIMHYHSAAPNDDYTCPWLVEGDNYWNEMPDDDFFCAYGERSKP